MKLSLIVNILVAVERFERREEKMGAGRAVFVQDQKLRKNKYKKFTDDGEKRLHEARFNPLPTGDPHDWADQVPVKREQVMKNLYMAHYGVGHGQVDTKTIVKVRTNSLGIRPNIARGIYYIKMRRI